MFKAREIQVFMPEDKIEEFTDVEFQSNPEMGMLMIFPEGGKQSVLYSGMSFKISMDGKVARESYELADKAQQMSMTQMKQMLAREQGPIDAFGSSFG